MWGATVTPMAGGAKARVRLAKSEAALHPPPETGDKVVVTSCCTSEYEASTSSDGNSSKLELNFAAGPKGHAGAAMTGTGGTGKEQIPFLPPSFSSPFIASICRT